MIYLDSSVALAKIFVEDRGPPPELWAESVTASRLLEYEIWTQLHARGLARSHGEEARALLARVVLLDLAPPVLARATEPFPIPLRTLDALHLASVEYLRGSGQEVQLATYDRRMAEAAQALGIALYPL